MTDQDKDRACAKALGVPGGLFIHGDDPDLGIDVDLMP